MRQSLAYLRLIGLLQSTDVLAPIVQTFQHNNVCKRQFTETQSRSMAEGIQAKTFMVVGLGNLDMPNTRHSIGMKVTDKLASKLGTSFVKNKQCESMIATVNRDTLTLILVKPKKPMNLNGRSISKTVKQYAVEPSNILLVHDHLDQRVGALSLKENGGTAKGHNGVKSVAACIPSGLEIPRITIGIDRPVSQNEVVDYVLGTFSKDEAREINSVVDKALIKISGFIAKRTGINILVEQTGKAVKRKREDNKDENNNNLNRNEHL